MSRLIGDSDGVRPSAVRDDAGEVLPPLGERDELRAGLLLARSFEAGGGCFHESVSCLGAAVAGAADVLPQARSNTSLSAWTSLSARP
jgi:hypothetical protein